MLQSPGEEGDDQQGDEGRRGGGEGGAGRGLGLRRTVERRSGVQFALTLSDCVLGSVAVVRTNEIPENIFDI